MPAEIFLYHSSRNHDGRSLMENYNVYQDIANRTGGDIYIGVVGPVRTGKSTFIKRFMETLVLPVAAESKRAEMTDELPQAGSGRTVMTTEPKFVPAKAVKINVAEGVEASVRLVDCVGYAVEGASGFEEEGAPRLVKTPWQDNPMPFEKAAEMGTEKVIRDHSTIGVLVTTDGSIADIDRSGYIAAEERAVAELKALGKPFVIVLNCREPKSSETLKTSLEEKYEAPVVALSAENMGEAEIIEVLKTALFEFPVSRIDVQIPKWVQSFPESHEIVSSVLGALKKTAANIVKMRDCFVLERLFDENADFENPIGLRMDLGKGNAEITIEAKPDLFYRTLSKESGEAIESDLELMQYVRLLSQTKKEYAKVKDALKEAEKNGYGIVNPTEEDYELEKPRLIKKGGAYGAQFRANASSYHILKVNVTGAVNTVIGTKEQGEEFIAKTREAYEAETGDVWEMNIFGKSLRTLVQGELSGKTGAMPIELRRKMRRTITKIVNDGKNNVICFLF